MQASPLADTRSSGLIPGALNNAAMASVLSVPTHAVPERHDSDIALPTGELAAVEVQTDALVTNEASPEAFAASVLLAQAVPAREENSNAGAAATQRGKDKKDDAGAAAAGEDDDDGGGLLWGLLGLGLLGAAAGGSGGTTRNTEDDEVVIPGDPTPFDGNLSSLTASALQHNQTTDRFKAGNIAIKYTPYGDGVGQWDGSSIDIDQEVAYSYVSFTAVNNTTELVGDGQFSVIVGMYVNGRFYYGDDLANIVGSDNTRNDLLVLWDPLATSNNNIGWVFENLPSELVFTIEGYVVTIADYLVTSVTPPPAPVI